MAQHPPHLRQMRDSTSSRLIIGITGASGSILAIRLLETLWNTGIHTHLVLSEVAPRTIQLETDCKDEVLSPATREYDFREINAPLASRSFATMRMVVIPCSIKTLSAISNSYANDVLTRAADVTL